MVNPSEDQGSFRGNDNNRYNQKNDFPDWPAGYSFQQSILQPLRGDEFFQQWRTQPRVAAFAPHGYSRYPNSSDFIRYGSQGSIASSSLAREDQSCKPTEPTLPIARGSKWSIAEDEKLCHAWVRVSTDPVAGDSQKKLTFWKRIHDDFVKQHGDNHIVTRSQRACERRFQFIRAECNKWSAALKKAHDYPRSARSFADSPLSEEKSPICTRHVDGVQTLNDPVENDHTRDSLHGSREEEPVDEDTPTSTGRRRAPGRKTMKDKPRSKKQKTDDSHSSVGERLVKSIDDLHAASVTEWERTSQLNQTEQLVGINFNKLKVIRERIAIEREMMQVDKVLYNEAPRLIGSPTDKEKRLAVRLHRIEMLVAEADALIDCSMVI